MQLLWFAGILYLQVKGTLSAHHALSYGAIYYEPLPGLSFLQPERRDEDT